MRQSTIVKLITLCLCVLTTFTVTLAAPTPAEKSFATAKQLYDTGSDQQAVKELQGFLATYPTDKQIPDATYMLGRCFQRQQQYGDALNAYTRVINIAGGPEFVPLRGRTHYQMAECYLAQKDYERAIRSYDNCLKLTKATDDLAVTSQYWKAECLYKLTRYDDAVSEYRKVAQVSPAHDLASWSYYSIGMIALQRARFDEAIPALEVVATRYKESEVIGDTLYALGLAYAGRARANTDAARAAARDEDFRKAIAAFTQVWQSDKTPQAAKQQAQLSIAQTHFDVKEYDKAEQAYAGVLAGMKPATQEAMEARFWHAHTLYNCGRFGEAITEYLQVGGSKDPELTTQALYWQGCSWHQLALQSKDEKAYREAIAAFQRFLAAVDEKHARAARATLSLAFCYEDLAGMGNADARGQALTTFNQILTKWPSTREVPEAQAGIARLTVTMSRDELRGVVGLLPEGAAAWGVNLRLAREEFLAGRYDGALAAARKVLEAKPTGELKAQASYLAGASLHKLGKPAEAIEAYQQVPASITEGELLPFAYRGLAQACLDTKRYKEARDAALVLTRYTLPDQERAEALMFLAEAYFGNQQSADALATYQKVLRDAPTSPLAPNAMMGVGWLAETKKDFDLAIATYREMIVKYPSHDLVAETFYRLGVCLVEEKDYAAAVDAFSNVPEGHTLAPQAAYAIAWALKDQGKVTEANEQFARLAEQFTQSPLAADSLFRVGEYWMEQKKYTEALPHLSRAVDLVKQEALAPLITHKLGVCAFFANDYALAANAFGKVGANYPTSEYAADSLFWRAQSLEKSGLERILMARDVYLQYVAKYPTQPFAMDAALGAGRTALLAKQYPAARTDLQKALDLCANLGRNAGNRELTERAKNVMPEAQYYLGQVSFEEKKYQEALKEFAAVAVYQLEPWYSQSILQMARCSLNTGDRQAAQVSLQLLRRNFPTSDAAKEAPKLAQENGLDLKTE